MIALRKSEDRGQAHFGWLEARYSFSFGRYRDPKHLGFRSLRVINEDRIDPSQGFDTHPHNNAEIITYVLEGELEHKDSMGNGAVIKAGELQLISAGSGITHSEFNPSKTKQTHLYQIWLEPSERDVTPKYEQKDLRSARKKNELILVASPTGQAESFQINQDAQLWVAELTLGSQLQYAPDASRYTWIQVISGNLDLNGQQLGSGDGAAISEETDLRLQVTRGESTEILMFDLP